MERKHLFRPQLITKPFTDSIWLDTCSQWVKKGNVCVVNDQSKWNITNEWPGVTQTSRYVLGKSSSDQLQCVGNRLRNTTRYRASKKTESMRWSSIRPSPIKIFFWFSLLIVCWILLLRNRNISLLRDRNESTVIIIKISKLNSRCP